MNIIDRECIGPVSLRSVMRDKGYYVVGEDSRAPNVTAIFYSGQHIDNATRHFHRVIELACQDLKIYP